MSTETATHHARPVPFGVPVAVLGVFAATLCAPPATATAATTDIAPVERQRSAPVAVAAAATTPPSYVVQPGDTISAVAARFNLRTEDVLAWNGLSWRSVIYPGHTLKLQTSSAPVSPSHAVALSPQTTHTVVAGDTVYAIAQKYSSSVDSIFAANGLTSSSVIFPGQRLAIPAETESQVVATSAPSVAAPQTTTASTPSSHTVVAGETVSGIAEQYGSTPQTLLALNSLTPSSIIYPGQSLVVKGSEAASSTSSQKSASLTAEQAENASLIIRVGREVGATERAIALALATGMVESELRNLSWGDRDSLGIFQQRPSAGWGSPAQIMDAERSTRVFYGGHHDPNGQSTRGLMDIPGWENLPFTEAAQAVQISAYPDRYGQWETQAYSWLALYG